jgi:hypothetical protein
MDYTNLRLELSIVLKNLRTSMGYIKGHTKKIFKNHNKINNNIRNIEVINYFYHRINDLHKFSNKYMLSDIVKIDFECVNLSDDEKNFINKNMLVDNTYNIERYKEELHLFNRWFIDGINEDIEKIKSIITLTEHEILFSLMWYYLINLMVSLDEREKFGYVMKLILNNYEYKLVKNIFTCLYDDVNDYNGYIRGKWKFVETYNEREDDYTTEYVEERFYDDDLDNEPTEYFEEKYDLYNSKYNEIQEFITKNNIQLVELN